MSDELKRALAAIATREPTKFVWEGSAADRIEALEREVAELRALLKEAREQLQEADSVVTLASKLMTVRMISKWTGCRAFLETVGETLARIDAALASTAKERSTRPQQS